MTLQLRLLGVLVLMLVALTARAQSPPSDFLGIENLPNAREMVREVKKDTMYNLVLGTFKKTGGTWTPDRERRVRGDVQRRTLELPDDFSAREGYDFYLEQLEQYPLRELFVCRERECGGSINWANNHFEVIQLYGLDQHQYYGVYEIARDEAVYYASLYAVRRGNRRVYVQLDLVKAAGNEASAMAANPETLGSLLRDEGYFVFPGVELTGSAQDWTLSLPEAHVEALVSLLEREEDWSVALVGHDYGAGDLDQQRADSLAYAQQLRATLVEAGIDEDRLYVHGLGGLAPAGRGDRSARIEVVRLPED